MPGFSAYCALLENLTADTLDQLDTCVHADVHFKDPFNDVHGIEHMRAILADMFDHVSGLRFKIHERIGEEPKAVITWTLSGTLRGEPWAVDGASYLTFDPSGLLTSHIDYWDAASGLYERFPVIGWLLRAIRRRLRIDSAPQ